MLLTQSPAVQKKCYTALKMLFCLMWLFFFSWLLFCSVCVCILSSNFKSWCFVSSFFVLYYSFIGRLHVISSLFFSRNFLRHSLTNWMGWSFLPILIIQCTANAYMRTRRCWLAYAWEEKKLRKTKNYNFWFTLRTLWFRYFVLFFNAPLFFFLCHSQISFFHVRRMQEIISNNDENHTQKIALQCRCCDSLLTKPLSK